MVDGYQEMLSAYMRVDPTGAMMRPPAPPPGPGGGPPGAPAGPSRGQNGKGPPKPALTQAPPPPGAGGPPPGVM